MRYFLITDHNRDGEHEYYDKVAIETRMTVKEFNSNKDFWQECFLAWQFGYVNQEGDDWWSDCRIVDVYDTQQITKEEFITRTDQARSPHLWDKDKAGNWVPIQEIEDLKK